MIPLWCTISVSFQRIWNHSPIHVYFHLYLSRCRQWWWWWRWWWWWWWCPVTEWDQCFWWRVETTNYWFPRVPMLIVQGTHAIYIYIGYFLDKGHVFSINLYALFSPIFDSFWYKLQNKSLYAIGCFWNLGYPGTPYHHISPLLPPARWQEFRGNLDSLEVPRALQSTEWVTSTVGSIEHTMILSSSLKYAGKSLDLDISWYISWYIYIDVFLDLFGISSTVHLACFVFTYHAKKQTKVWLLPVVNPITMYPRRDSLVHWVNSCNRNSWKSCSNSCSRLCSPSCRRSCSSSWRQLDVPGFYGGFSMSELFQPNQVIETSFPRGKSIWWFPPTSPVSHVGSSLKTG